MRRHPFFQTLWYAMDFLLIGSLILLAFGVMREYSTRRYLKGFADAIVPLSTEPEQKVEAILAWIKHGPARRTTTTATDSLAPRDPRDTLNYRELLQVCGTATNAFVNLATSSGLQARRLLLLDENLQSKHVVAEVRVEGRWVVVDPAYRAMLRDAQGQPLTRQQLNDPRLLREAAQRIEGYPREYSFERSAYVRLARVPVVGKFLRRTLDSLLPRWEEKMNWTLVLERKSFAVTLLALLLVCFSLVGRLVLSWYGKQRLGITRLRLREQLMRAGVVLFSQSR